MKERKDYKECLSAYLLFMSVYPNDTENLSNEEWRWIREYAGIYKISNYSRIKSYQNGVGKILKPYLSRNGYLCVSLSKFGEVKHFRLHRLVAQAFIPNPDNLPEVDHINGDRLNCTVTNLRYVTRQQNMHYAREMVYNQNLEDDNMSSAELVFIKNNQALTDSLKVAEYFGKPHNDVLKAIRKLIDEIRGLGNFSHTPLIDQMGGVLKIGETPMFKETTYIHEQNGQVYPMYYMNRDGFTLLAMGFTGKEALKFKLAYITKFNEMEKLVKSQSSTLGLTALEKIKLLDKYIEMTENPNLRDELIQQAVMLINHS